MPLPCRKHQRSLTIAILRIDLHLWVLHQNFDDLAISSIRGEHQGRRAKVDLPNVEIDFGVAH